MAMVYKWGSSPVTRRVTADVAGRELERIAEAHGGAYTPRDVWVENRAQNAPLHDEFTWNDTLAADRWRDNEASHLIRHLVRYENPDAEPVRAFVSVTREGDGRPTYTAITRVLASPVLRDQMIQQAWADWKAFERKYQRLLDLSDARRAIEAALNRKDDPV